MYSQALQQLLACYRGDPALRALPLVVNTDGWVRGCVPSVCECVRERGDGGSGGGHQGGNCRGDSRDGWIVPSCDT